MLEASRGLILDRMDEGDLVLDVGGWAEPFARADWVLDLLPYETRGLYGRSPDPRLERFSAQTWVQRDACDRTPWPFEDDLFDFAICSHTLEDVRDPIWVCGELTRVARAGYVEVPSRLEEQSYGVQGPWVGWGHHHWLIDVDDGRIDFVFKHHVLHGRASDHFPAWFAPALRPEQRVQCMWWDGAFDCSERIFSDVAKLDRYLADFVDTHMREPTSGRRSPRARLRGRPRIGRVVEKLRRSFTADARDR